MVRINRTSFEVSLRQVLDPGCNLVLGWGRLDVRIASSDETWAFVCHVNFNLKKMQHVPCNVTHSFPNSKWEKGENFSSCNKDKVLLQNVISSMFVFMKRIGFPKLHPYKEFL